MLTGDTRISRRLSLNIYGPLTRPPDFWTISLNYLLRSLRKSRELEWSKTSPFSVPADPRTDRLFCAAHTGKSCRLSTTPCLPHRVDFQRDPSSIYKSQYEQLEAELADFQASSKELEGELEKDVEAAETRERQLKEKVESLGYEADEWKVGAYSPSTSEKDLQADNKQIQI